MEYSSTNLYIFHFNVIWASDRLVFLVDFSSRDLVLHKQRSHDPPPDFQHGGSAPAAARCSSAALQPCFGASLRPGS